MDMFCEQCEQILSRDERAFSEQMFRPRHSAEGWEGFEYGPWLLRFAVGLALRNAFPQSDELARHRASLPGPGGRLLRTRAVPGWRGFLLDQASNSGEYEFHLLLLDYVRQSTVPLADRIQWYLMRSVDMTVVSSPSGRAALYTLLPGFAFWVSLVPKREVGWSGTRIHWKGRMEAPLQQVNGYMLDFVNERAQMASEMGRDMSLEQLSALSRRVERSGDRLVTSKSAEARAAQAALRAPPGRPDSSKQRPPAERLAADRQFLEQQNRRTRRSRRR